MSKTSPYKVAAKLGIVGIGRGARRALGRNAKALVRRIVDAKHRR